MKNVHKIILNSVASIALLASALPLSVISSSAHHVPSYSVNQLFGKRYHHKRHLRYVHHKRYIHRNHHKIRATHKHKARRHIDQSNSAVVPIYSTSASKIKKASNVRKLVQHHYHQYVAAAQSSSQNGQHLYRYWPFAGTPISQYRGVNPGKKESMPYFHTLETFNQHYFGRHAQSLNIVPSGHFAFVGFDSYDAGYVRLVRFNLQRGGIKVGPWFYGGHGQAIGYNPTTNQLWDLSRDSDNEGDSDAGEMSYGEYVAIDGNTLRPTYRHTFNMQGEDLGDDLTFDNKGNAYNAQKVYSFTRTHHQFKHFADVYYKGEITEHGSEWQRIEGVNDTQTSCTQGIAYNPHNNKLYTQGSDDNAVTSVNANKLSNNTANRNDVHQMRMHNQYQEPEGIGFDKYGYGYNLMSSNYNGYARIMKSNTKFGNNK